MGFTVTADHLAWINGEKDYPDDLCLHGHAAAVIGGRTLEYECATVSATALYLLKTLTEDHIIHQDNQMLPCCGFFMLANETLDNVTVIGCPNGVDWTVLHRSDGTVSLILGDGTEETVSPEAYRAEVFRFADMIEDFYASCSPKVMPEDPTDRDGYTAFWNEWHRRRGRRNPAE